MADADRPLSPHLQVYRPQLTSVLSIFHRLTGVVLSFGTLILAWWLMAAASGPDYFNYVQDIVGSWFGYLLLFGWSVCLFYHFCNGIRHLFWDIGKGYELDAVYRSGWAVVLATGALTVIAWAVGLTMIGGA